MSIIQVAMIQMDVLWEDPEENHIKIRDLLERVSRDTSVCVLPELWSCCYSAPFLKTASQMSPQLLETVRDWSRERLCWTIAGSLPWKEGGALFNRSWVITDAGTAAGFYDKTHLFSLTRESEVFTPGSSPFIFRMGGFTCAVIICYDLRFPELARALAIAGVELLFVVAQWPQRRIDAWKILLRATAVQNQLFVVGCNRCGVADVPYGGCSAVISPWGERLAAAEDGEGIFLAKVDRAEVEKARKRMPFFQDRRPELYAPLSSSR